jgi:low temperature requirement protein LtrA
MISVTGVPRKRLTALTEGAKVTPVELFLDLVFVYGFTQVTGLMAHDLTWQGLIRGMLLLALLWWLWTGFAWLGNMVQADEGPVKLVLFVVMALVFIMDVTIPEAFHDNETGGLYGPWVFAICYLLVQLIHNATLFQAAKGQPEVQRNTLQLLIPHVIAVGLLLWAGKTHDWTQTLLWAAAVLVTTVGIFLIRAEGWRLSAASHFAERHGLIVIIALGESIVSIGVGVSLLPVSWEIIAASVLGIAVAAALWWLYFDVVAIAVEHAVHDAHEYDRPRLARDAYTYMHLPMIAGIILMSLGLKKVFEHLGDPLTSAGIAALFGGVTLYLLAQVGFTLRGLGKTKWHRLVIAGLLVVLMPVVMAIELPALGDLALLAVIMVGLTVLEVSKFSLAREEIRHHTHAGENHSGQNHSGEAH